jgi:hypothetical protein
MAVQMFRHYGVLKSSEREDVGVATQYIIVIWEQARLGFWNLLLSHRKTTDRKLLLDSFNCDMIGVYSVTYLFLFQKMF